MQWEFAMSSQFEFWGCPSDVHKITNYDRPKSGDFEHRFWSGKPRPLEAKTLDIYESTRRSVEFDQNVWGFRHCIRRVEKSLSPETLQKPLDDFVGKI